MDALERQVLEATMRRCKGSPADLEDMLQTAFDKANKRPDLRLVVDNRPRG